MPFLEGGRTVLNVSYPCAKKSGYVCTNKKLSLTLPRDTDDDFL